MRLGFIDVVVIVLPFVRIQLAKMLVTYVLQSRHIKDGLDRLVLLLSRRPVLYLIRQDHLRHLVLLQLIDTLLQNLVDLDLVILKVRLDVRQLKEPAPVLVNLLVKLIERLSLQLPLLLLELIDMLPQRRQLLRVLDLHLLLQGEQFLVLELLAPHLLLH